MKEISIGDEFWTLINHDNRDDMIAVKKITIAEVHGVMVTVNADGIENTIDVPKEALYETQEEALAIFHQAQEAINK